MRKITPIYPPPHTMSPEELADCRRHLEQQWKTRHVDEALLQRAWKTAHQIAAMLYQDFGATRVAVFGSLAERDWFTQLSDIDIVAWGMPNEAYWDAYGKVVYFDETFNIDFVTFEETKGLFRERLQRQAVFIENRAERTPQNTFAGDVPPRAAEQRTHYEMNRSRLIQRIDDERAKIERTVGSIAEALDDMKVVAPNHSKYIEESIAMKLTKVYDGIETIFERIARAVDRHVPNSEKWHNELLQQMGARRTERPPVISEETAAQLKDLLEFRHKVRNIYGDELIYELTEAHAKRINELFARVCADLDTFATSLKKEENSE